MISSCVTAVHWQHNKWCRVVVLLPLQVNYYSERVLLVTGPIVFSLSLSVTFEPDHTDARGHTEAAVKEPSKRASDRGVRKRRARAENEREERDTLKQQQQRQRQTHRFTSKATVL